MTSLTFYGGVNEIGGNKILLEDKGVKIFLDFGMSFGRHRMYFDKFMKPRTNTGIRDFIEMGLIPDLKNIYREDLMNHIGRKSKDPDIDAVLLSHAHADHANYISFLHEKIPIYMGKTCQTLLEAIQERSVRSMDNEILSYKPIDDDDKIDRDIHTFRTGKKFNIAHLKVEPIHVDHSIPGAYGFIIHTSSGDVVYTGDLRVHGTKSEMTREFITKAKKVKPIALITEGTRLNDLESQESEQKVYQDCKQKVKDTNRLVLADFSIKDVDRFSTFYKIAKETGRKLVINVNDTPYLKHLSTDPNLKVPKPDDSNILIYKPKKSVYRRFEQDYFEQDNIRTAEELYKDESKILCAFGFWDFGSLIDMKPKSGALYIHSSSEPFSEEGEIDDRRINNWLKNFGLYRFQSHCSGHAKSSDLVDMVKEINAKNLYPIHCEQPEAYKRIANNMTLILEGRKYEIK